MKNKLWTIALAVALVFYVPSVQAAVLFADYANAGVPTTYTLDVELSDTGDQIKAKIQVESGLDPLGMVLVYNGIVILDGTTLSDNGISIGETISMYFEVSGCTDGGACNYDLTAITDDGSCTYPEIYYFDGDLDGFGDASNTVADCVLPAGYVTNGDDCDDVTWYFEDADLDGFGSMTLSACGVIDNTDCDDSNLLVNSGMVEVCNDMDDDCDGETDEFVQLTFYADVDQDGFGDLQNTTFACTAPVGFVSNSDDCDDSTVSYEDLDGDGFGSGVPVACGITDNTDCDDSNMAINPGVVEICNNVDDDCDGELDNGVPLTDYFADDDGDGFGGTVLLQSCSDPGAGYVTVGGDCNDLESSISPSAQETCNNVDDNCDGSTDEGVMAVFYLDVDLDGFGDANATTEACTVPAGYASNLDDCDDTQAGINPLASEICNTVDENCDGQADEGVQNTYYIDFDNDGFGTITTSVLACTAPVGFVDNSLDCDDNQLQYEDLDGDGFGSTVAVACGLLDNSDCDDNQWLFLDEDGDGYGSNTSVACGLSDSTDCQDLDPGVNPGAVEICNNDDENCNGLLNEGVDMFVYTDADGDGFGDASTAQSACEVVSGYSANGVDCDDTQLTYWDADGDGYGVGLPIACGVALNGDCADNDVTINPSIAEVCDGIDQDCDGNLDNGVLTTFYHDVDEDGYGDPLAILNSCDIVPGYVDNSADCDDNNVTYEDLDGDGYGSVNPSPCGVANINDCDDINTSINPGQVELCGNGVDENCDGTADENCLFYGCTDPGACNFMPGANVEDGSCSYPVPAYDCAGNCISDLDGDGICDQNEILGCTDPVACNYNSLATDNDGTCDLGLIYYQDSDGDGFGLLGASLQACTQPAGYVISNTDCNDGDFNINPWAVEICNGMDENCSGENDEGVLITYYFDGDSDGFGDLNNPTFDCSVPSGYVVNGDDCNDGAITYLDADGDGYGSTTWDACGLFDFSDCDDSNSLIFPNQVEVCNNVDEDCNGLVDDGLVFNTYYVDADNDGYGTGSMLVYCIVLGQGYAAVDGDCDDLNGLVNPSVVEQYNSIDDNCDGSVDEGFGDTDGDGVADVDDADDDNDGLLDSIEDDFNGDGIGGDDCDMDGIPNRLDTDQCEVFIPEGFTPNGDGMNDLFVISMLPVDAKIELEVYNRWGGLVYVSSDYANDWDGTNLDGNDLPVGTYFYVVKLTNEKLSYTNSLTLWR